MKHQQQVAAVVDHDGVETPPAYRLLDVTAELGELAAEINESTGYGTDPDAVTVPEERLGDALFALLALCEQVDVDADRALSKALAKYEGREPNDAPTDGGRSQ